MRISACVAFFSRLFITLLLIGGFSLFFLHASPAYAQTPSVTTSQSTQALNDFRTPEADPTVPRNSHSYAQIVMIDVLSAVICQLSGVDPVNPQQPCVSFDQSSGKFGLAQQPNQFGQASQTHVGGALGVMANQIALLYQPPISASTYFNYLSSNFGIVPKAYAQNAQLTDCTNVSNGSFGYGYCGLNPIFNIWKLSRDMSYTMLVIACVLLGLAIMLRFKIDPRTVMTAQNQVPRIVIALGLITFSYPISGGMIDVMWTATYMGIGAITNGSTLQSCNASGQMANIGNAAPQYLLLTPLGFTNRIFATACDGAILGVGINNNGILKLANDTGGAVGNSVTSLILTFVGIDINEKDSCGIGIGKSPVNCIYYAFGFLISLVVKLIVIITLLITLVRLWFQLLKNTVLFMIDAVAGPIYIGMGLFPGRPLGFEKWLRRQFGRLVAFPLCAWGIVGAAVLAQSYPKHPDPSNIFVPPLVGNPNVDGFGVMLAFGLLLILPGIPDLMMEKMKVPGGKIGAQVRGGIAAGASLTGGASGAGMKRLTRRYDPETGKEAGALRQFAYGRVLGMKGKDPNNTTTQTTRYRLARKVLGGSMGVSQDSPRGHH